MESLMKREEKTSFIDFCSEERELLLISLAHIVSCVPSAMNKMDNRFDISNFYCNELERDFSPTLKEHQSIGFDMFYNDKERISIKFQKKFFQRMLKSLELGKPSIITIKNFLTTINRTNKVNGFDYLFVVENELDKIKNKVNVGFGIARPEIVQKYIIKSNTDQLRAQIPNDAWDYFSGVETFDMDLDDNKQNRRYHYSKRFMFDLLRGIV